MARDSFLKIPLLRYSQNRLEKHCHKYHQHMCIAAHMHCSTCALQHTCIAGFSSFKGLKCILDFSICNESDLPKLRATFIFQLNVTHFHLWKCFWIVWGCAFSEVRLYIIIKDKTQWKQKTYLHRILIQNIPFLPANLIPKIIKMK